MTGRFTKVARRTVRKHRTLAIGAVIVLLGLLAPLLAGRQLSPADIFQLYAPWRTADIVPANGQMNDAATAWFTAVPMLRRSLSAFVWNPFLGSGTAGWHSAGHGLLSPFALVPALLLPLGFFFVGIIVLKFAAALLLGYGWLRQERLGREAAAVGAIVVAAAGAASMWWLWPSTSATVVCPAVLWIVARMREGRRTPILLTSLTALAILLSGYPAAVLYVFYLGCAYAIHAAAGSPRRVLRRVATVVAGGAIAAAIAFPALAPFAETVRRSGYLERRSNAAFVVYPASNLLSLVKPYRLIREGEGWVGDPALGQNDSLPESTIYVGKLTLLLAAAASFLVRRRIVVFWVGAAAVLLGAMFGLPIITDLVAALPGMRYTPLTRLRFLLPVAFGCLAAIGVRHLLDAVRRRSLAGARWRWVAAVVVAAVAIDLTLFLRSFTPYIDAELSVPRSTAALDWLQAQPRPFRIAALGTTLWPDTAEYVGLEDIRSHYPVEREYRRLLAQIDPKSFGSSGTVLLLHPETADLESPALSFLNVRFMLEDPRAGLLDRRLAGRTRFDSATPTFRRLSAGEEVEIEDHEAGGATALAVELRSDGGAEVEIGRVVHRMPGGVTRVYVPAAPTTIRVRRGDVEVRSRQGGAVDVGTTDFPWIPAYRSPDLVVFRNLAALDRFHAVPAGHRPPPQVQVAATDGTLLVATRSAEPFTLASSEKLTDELTVTLDGLAVSPTLRAGLFASIEIPAGRHTLRVGRRIPPQRLAVSVLGLIALAVAAFLERRRGAIARRETAA